MKYAVIVTYTSGEKTGAVVSADGHAGAWGRVSEMFNMSYVRAVELSEIMAEDRFEHEGRNYDGDE